MLIQPLFSYIPSNHINIIPDWNLHPFVDEMIPATLNDSFKSMGIMHPPIVQLKANGKFDLICGRRRLQALRTYYHQSQILCMILPSELPISSILHYVLTDQQLNSPLSLMETAYFLKCCTERISGNEITKSFLPLLGYKPQPDLFSQFSNLLKLDKNIQQQIHLGNIDSKIAFDLLNLPDKDQLTFLNLIQSLQPGGGKQKRLLFLSRDIAHRTQQTISTLFEGAEFKQIIEHNEMNPPQKIHALLELLQRKFYPESSNAEQRFREKVRRLDLPDNLTVTHSLNFEKDEVFLTIRFPDLQSCENAWHKHQII